MCQRYVNVPLQDIKRSRDSDRTPIPSCSPAGTRPIRPSIATRHPCSQSSVDSIRDDLPEGDHDDVEDKHPIPETHRGKILDVEWGDAGCKANAGADQETASI